VPYYCVIGGWITKYIVAMILNPIAKFSKDSVISAADGSTSSWSSSYFVNFITSPVEPVIYFLIFAAMVAVVVAFGVQKGVERSSKILLPMLVILILAICVYCFFIPGASAGLTYYFRPDFMKFSYMTVVAAMGQLFYSLSLAMGIMITYGSYMRKEDDLISSVNHVEIFDTAISFLAGLMIIPALVAFGGEEAARSAGPGLVFVTMPQVFADFPGGQFFAILFFVLVLFAAVTSAVSLLETNVHTFCEQFKLSRKNSIVICVLEIVVLGTLTVLGYSVLSNVHPLFFIEKFKNLDILDSMDTVSNYILMPIGAIFTTLLVTAVIGLDKFSNEIQQQGKWYRKYIYQFCMCLVVIPCLLIILLNSLGIIK